MPTRLQTNFPQPKDSDEFEVMVRDICALEWGDPNTKEFGRTGQKQYGVDVYGKPVNLNQKYRAVQCKLRTEKDQLTKEEIEKEVGDARQFPHELDILIIATTAPRDTHTQILVDRISRHETSSGGFRVIIWFWDDITERLAAYPKLIVKYYPDFYANLTTLPVVERLIDTPLQIVSVANDRQNISARIKEALQFRGIRILDLDRYHTISSNRLLNEVLPDGIVCSYGVPVSESTESSLLQFAGNIQNYIQRVESLCPVFVVLPSSLTAQFLQSFATLGGKPQRIIILNTDMPLNEIADQMFQSVFRFGYERRACPTTIDIAVRTREGKPDSVLLDMDWRSRLSTSVFPTPDEWGDVFISALMAVRNQLLNQSDRTRIQIICQIPLPAAFALGFFFNLRIARVGVWARKAGGHDFKQQFWLSDGNPADSVFEPEWIKRPDGRIQSAIVELTSYTAIHKAIELFLTKSGQPFGAWLRMCLAKDGKPIANVEESYAVAYSNQVGQTIRRLNEQGITDIHLFARIPSPLAVLIGQRLQACGRIHLYWFDNSSYRYAFTLA